MTDNNVITFAEKEVMGHYSHLCLSSLENPSLGPSAKCVHIYFSTRAKSWKIYIRVVCKKLGISERTYQRALLELEEKGYLYRIHKQRVYWQFIRCDFPTTRKEIEKLIPPNWELYEARQNDAPNRPVKMTPQLDNNTINKVLNIIDSNDSSKDEYVLPQKGATQVHKKLKRRPNKQNISLALQRNNKPAWKEPKVIAPKIKELLDYHNIILHKYRPNSGAYFESAKTIKDLLNGVFFKNMNGRYPKYKDRKFTAEEIRNVLQRISLANSPDYYPSDKTPLKQSFNLLAYNSRMSNEIFKSNFLYYLENEPKHCGNGVSLTDDPHPEFTETFKSFYKDSIVAGAKQNYTIVQENKFIDAANKAWNFFEENKPRMHVQRKSEYIQVIMDAIKDSTPLKNIEIGTLCSPRTWEKIVPVYLADQGILDQVRQM